MKYIKLPNNLETSVSDEDFQELSRYRWRFMWKYVVRHEKKWEYFNLKDRKVIAMHTQIMNTPAGLFIDHINHNPLDNTRENLRICTTQQNNCNKRKLKMTTHSQYKWVSYYKNNNKWTASVRYNWKSKYLWSFSNEKEAANAYIEAAKIIFWEFYYA